MLMPRLWMNWRLPIIDFRCIICKAPCAKEPSFCAGCMAILPWLSPHICLLCGALCDEGDDVLRDKHRDKHRDEHRDERGHRLVNAPSIRCCPACENRFEPFQHRLAVFEYAFPVDALLKTFKYQEKRAIGRSMGQLLGLVAQSQGLDNVDYLLPVPLAWPRRKSRGFNQAADIAEACSEIIKVPWTDRWLQRQADTPKLAGLNPVERRFALLGAFAASSDVAGKHIVLIDDVMTSGATCLELNRELMDRGARSVSVWTVARTVRSD